MFRTTTDAEGIKHLLCETCGETLGHPRNNTQAARLKQLHACPATAARRQR